MSYQDELRAHQEHLRLAGSHRRVFNPAKVSAELPEPYTAPEAALSMDDVSHEDIVVAIAELSRRTQTSYATIDNFVRARSTGRSVPELVVALAAVADQFGVGAGDHDDDLVALSVSAEERRELAARGQAIGPQGDFPIPDRGHLMSAIARYKEGKLAGHSAA